MNNPSKTFAEIATAVAVTDYLDYREYLAAIHAMCKENFARYSYGQFAVDLGFSATNVIHLIVQGKRPLTTKAARKIADRLELRGLRRQYFSALVKYHAARKPADKDRHFKKLFALKEDVTKNARSKHQLEYFESWYNVAIRELLALPDAQDHADWICDHLTPRVRPEQVKIALELLDNLGYRDQQRISTGDEVDSIAVISFHQQMIDIAKHAISTFAETERDISAITIGADLDTIAKIKSEIALFRKKILTMAESKSKSADRVMQLNFQLFPLTKPVKTERGRA